MPELVEQGITWEITPKVAAVAAVDHAANTALVLALQAAISAVVVAPG